MQLPLAIKPAEGNRDFVSIHDAANNRIVVAILLKDAQDIINACNSHDQLFAIAKAFRAECVSGPAAQYLKDVDVALIDAALTPAGAK